MLGCWLRWMMWTSLGLGAIAVPATAASMFTILGELGGGFSSAADVSANGSFIVGISRDAGGTSWAVRWSSNGTPQTIPRPALFSSAISADGQVVAGRGLSNRSYIWNEADGVTDLGALPNDRGLTQANGISGDGKRVVGYAWTTTGTEAFAWTEGTGIARLVRSGGQRDAQAQDASGDGTQLAIDVNIGTSGQVIHAHHWTERLVDPFTGDLFGSWVDLGDLPGGQDRSSASAISPDGNVIVGDSSIMLGTRAFRWTAASGMADLGVLPGFTDSRADAVDATGSIVVGSATRSGGSAAFIWTEASGMLALDDVLATNYGLHGIFDGWTFFSASAISDDGLVIAGNGVDPNGLFQAWTVQLDHIFVPEPSVLQLLAVLLACFAAGLSRGMSRPGSGPWRPSSHTSRFGHARVTRFACEARAKPNGFYSESAAGNAGPCPS